MGRRTVTVLIVFIPLLTIGTLGYMMLFIGFFLLRAVLSAGFGVAETQVLFQLAPPDAPKGEGFRHRARCRVP